jgi:hypothetical protein
VVSFPLPLLSIRERKFSARRIEAYLDPRLGLDMSKTVVPLCVIEPRTAQLTIYIDYAIHVFICRKYACSIYITNHSALRQRDSLFTEPASDHPSKSSQG